MTDRTKELAKEYAEMSGFAGVLEAELSQLEVLPGEWVLFENDNVEGYATASRVVDGKVAGGLVSVTKMLSENWRVSSVIVLRKKQQ